LVAFEAMARMQPALSFHDIPLARPPATMKAMLDDMLLKLKAVDLNQAIVVDLPSEMDDFAFVFVCVPGLEFAANKPNYTPGARMLNFLSKLKRKSA
jgi:hypothetical protein